MYKYSFSVILFFFISLSAFGQKSEVKNRIDSLINLKTDKPFNGIILISQNGKALYRKVIGYSDIEKKKLLEWNSEFVIGSISKQITAVLILQEYEKGKIELNNPIAKYLPQLKENWANEITAHHLLTHTHGITALDKPLAFPAGTQYEYSQIGYELLSQILEKVTNKTFVSLSAKLFKECKMNNTFYPINNSKFDSIKGYFEDENGNIVIDNRRTDYVAAGGFVSTAEDLLRWNKCLFDGKLLKESTCQLMISPKDKAIRNHPVFGKTKYGYGITIEDKNGLLQLGQTGYAPGFVSMDFYFPKSKTSVIVLENISYDNDNLKKTFYYHSHILDIVKDNLSK